MSRRTSNSFILTAKAKDGRTYSVWASKDNMHVDAARTKSDSLTVKGQVDGHDLAYVANDTYLVVEEHNRQGTATGASTKSATTATLGIAAGSSIGFFEVILIVGSEERARRTVYVLEDGKQTMWQRVYKSTNSSTAPTTNLPQANGTLNGWTEAPSAISGSQRYRWRCERWSNSGTLNGVAWSTPVIDTYLPEDGRSITIKGDAVAVTDITNTVAGLNDAEVRAMFSIPASIAIEDGDVVLYNNPSTSDDLSRYSDDADEFFDDVAAENDGYILKANGHLWVRKGIGASKKWSDAGQIVGPAGKDAVTWRLEASTTHFRFRRDYAGVLSATPQDSTLRVVKSEGEGQTVYDTAQSALPNGMHLGWIDPNHAWTAAPNVGVVSAATLMTYTGNAVFPSTSIGLYKGGTVQSDFTVAGGTLIAKLTFSAIMEVQRMLVPAGRYVKNASPTKTWQLTDRTCPLVLYGDRYFSLEADSASTDCTTDASNEPKVNGASKWRYHEDYEVVLTKMLFAWFARMGGFVVYEDFFFSQYGTLFINNDGTVQEIAVDAGNCATEYQTGDGTRSVPYGFFSFSDPMPDADSTPEDEGRFRPALCMNAKTGETWLAGGKVHMSPSGDVSVEGTIRANNLYRRAAVYMPWGSGTRAFVTDNDLAADKVMEWYYMTETYGTLTYGKIYSLKEVLADIGEENVGNITESNGFRPCVGYADFVAVCDRWSTVHTPWTQDGSVYLPPPALFKGKTIEVKSFTDVRVQVKDAPGMGIIKYPFVTVNNNDPTDITLSVANNTAQNIPLPAGGSAAFYSIGSRWMAMARL